MSGLTRDGAVEPVSQDQILRRKPGQQEEQKQNYCSADHEQDLGRPYSVDTNSAKCDETVHVCIHKYIYIYY